MWDLLHALRMSVADVRLGPEAIHRGNSMYAEDRTDKRWCISSNCPGVLSVAAVNIRTKSNLGRGGSIWLMGYSASFEGAKAGTQAEARRNAVFWITPYLAQPALLYSPDHQPRGGTAHSRLLHPQLITNQENVPEGWLTSKSELPEACSQLRFPLSDGSGGQNANIAILMATRRERSRAGMNDLLWDGTVLPRVHRSHASA